MDKKKSRYFETAAKMDDAFLSLLEQKELPFITVKEICERAQVNRSTFYLHYETIGDLLTETVERVNRQFLDCMGKNPRALVPLIDELPIEDLRFVNVDYLVPYLTYVKKNRKLFRTALDCPEVLGARGTYQKMFEYVFAPILERHHVPERDRRYLMAFYVHGLMAIVEEWMRGDCADDIEHVVGVMRRCVPQ